jgi:hypothetical protein
MPPGDRSAWSTSTWRRVLPTIDSFFGDIELESNARPSPSLNPSEANATDAEQVDVPRSKAVLNSPETTQRFGCDTAGCRFASELPRTGEEVHRHHNHRLTQPPATTASPSAPSLPPVKPALGRIHGSLDEAHSEAERFAAENGFTVALVRLHTGADWHLLCTGPGSTAGIGCPFLITARQDGESWQLEITSDRHVHGTNDKPVAPAVALAPPPAPVSSPATPEAETSDASVSVLGARRSPSPDELEAAQAKRPKK